MIIKELFDNLTRAVDHCDIKFSKLFIYKSEENEENEENEKIELAQDSILNNYFQDSGPDFYIFLQ